MLLGPSPGEDASVVENPSTLRLPVLGLAACTALGTATGPLGDLLTQTAAVRAHSLALPGPRSSRAQP
jgi:hydrogenase-4 component F